MQTFVELFIRNLHLIASIFWFGGVFFFTFVAIPIGQRKLPAKVLLDIHNRFRHAMRLIINIILLTGGIVIFIVAWNNDMKVESEYMVCSVAKLGAFGIMALFWGLYSSSYQRHLEATHPDRRVIVPRHINVFSHLTLFSGLVVFALAMLLRS
ncbi:hypothetical protein F4X73_11625 [Candidatus Poribacteria bacterium]|nr:hypothetical protein [Candidatus Poribacteria bacterium]MYB65330.1 hypothetical protein [Candidatus Poribacteria bacterium]